MATLKDVAKEAGLTVTTVSRVLNNRGYISEDARQRVKEAMERLNYQPNELARSLTKQTSNTIGLIVPHISHPYFSKLIECLESEFSKRQYQILLHNTNGEKESFDAQLASCNSNRVAGVVLCSGEVDSMKFTNLNLPVISLERPIDNCAAIVECDNYLGGRLAAERLLKAGCQNLLYIGTQISENSQMPGEQRVDGFLDTCRAAGVRCREIEVDYNRFARLAYQDVLEDIIRENPDADGVFASSDVMAAYLIQALHEKGISVPEQVKVIGFDDVLVSTLTYPPLTTIHQPIPEMAEMTARIMDDILKGRPYEKKNVLSVELVERGSA